LSENGHSWLSLQLVSFFELLWLVQACTSLYKLRQEMCKLPDAYVYTSPDSVATQYSLIGKTQFYLMQLTVL
jgi:hypothetical protein